jgi:hypothetical protein
MKQERSYIITLLGDYNILGAIIMILSLTPAIKLLPITVILPEYLKLFSVPAGFVTGFLAILTLVAAYGYLKLKKWGYWLIVSEHLLFLAGWLFSYLHNRQNIFAPFPFSALIELIFIVPTVNYFYRTTKKTLIKL